MNYCTITPSRGDRPGLLQFCVKQLQKINGVEHVMNAYIINEKPKSAEVDIVPRVRQGIEMAKRDGFEFVFIIEDDDFYPDNYFSLYGDLSGLDFVGYSDTVYYNLKTGTYETLNHPGRSSLFCTGFRISALDRFNWPNDNEKFLDVKLWDYCMRYSKNDKLLKGNPCLGIKAHGQGKVAGKGHVIPLKQRDNDDLSFLKSRVDEESFQFYKQLMESYPHHQSLGIRYRFLNLIPRLDII